MGQFDFLLRNDPNLFNCFLLFSFFAEFTYLWQLSRISRNSDKFTLFGRAISVFSERSFNHSCSKKTYVSANSANSWKCSVMSLPRYFSGHWNYVECECGHLSKRGLFPPPFSPPFPRPLLGVFHVSDSVYPVFYFITFFALNK